jgi:hypothetical protein
MFHHPFVRKALEMEIGISYKDLTWREQGQLLRFLIEANTEKCREVIAFLHKHGLPAAQALLSCEIDPDMVDVFIQEAKKNTPERLALVFRRYAELSRFAQEQAEEAFHDIGYAIKDERMVSRFRELLLISAHEYLRRDMQATHIDESEDRKNMILIAHIFRTVLKEEKASLEDLKSCININRNNLFGSKEYYSQQFAFINGSNVNVRKGPGKEYEKVGTVEIT